MLRFLRFVGSAWVLADSKEPPATGYRVLDVNYFYPDHSDPITWASQFFTGAYVLVDPENEHVTHVNERHGSANSNAKHGRQVDKLVITGFRSDPYTSDLLQNQGLRNYRPFDAVVGHLALDRACASLTSLNGLLRNVSSLLRVGGVFSGIVLDANVVVKTLRLREAAKQTPRIEREIGPAPRPRAAGAAAGGASASASVPIFSIELLPKRGATKPSLSFPTSAPPFGHPVRVQFGQSRPMTVYLTYPKAVREAAARYGFELVFWQNATEHVSAFTNVITEGSDSSWAAASDPTAEQQPHVTVGANLVDDYTTKIPLYSAERRAAAAQLAKGVLKEDPPTKDQWHALYLIASFAFRKVRDVAPDTLASMGAADADGGADVADGGEAADGAGEDGHDGDAYDGDGGDGGDGGDDGAYDDDGYDDDY